MRPATVDIVSGNNEAFQILIPITNSDGTPFDFTGYSDFQMEVRSDPFHPLPILTFLDGVGIQVEGAAAAGVIALYAPEEDVTPLVGLYYCDARGVVGGKTEVIFRGTIEIVQGITYDVS